MRPVSSHCGTLSTAGFSDSLFQSFLVSSPHFPWRLQKSKFVVYAEILRRSQAKQGMFIQTSGKETYRLNWALANSPALLSAGSCCAGTQLGTCTSGELQAKERAQREDEENDTKSREWDKQWKNWGCSTVCQGFHDNIFWICQELLQRSEILFVHI